MAVNVVEREAEQRVGMTVPEVASALGISRNGAYELIRQGVIPAVRLGKRIVVPRETFARWLDETAVETVRDQVTTAGIR